MANILGLFILVVVVILTMVITWLATGRLQIYREFATVITAIVILTGIFVAILETASDLSAQNQLFGYFGGSALIGLLILFLGYRINKHLNKPLRNVISSNDRVINSKDLTHRTFTLDTTYELQKMVSQHRELTLTFSDIIQLVQDEKNKVETLTENIRSQTSALEEDMGDITSDIDRIIQLATKASNQIEEINQLGDSIRAEIESQFNLLKEATRYNNSITDQTNLIAVNAAIEATHSNTEESNFETVAEGIQQLASRSRDNTNKLAEIVVELDREIKNQLRDLNKKLLDLEDTIVEIGTISNRSSSYSHSQLRLVEEITNYLKQISTSSQELYQDLDEYRLT